MPNYNIQLATGDMPSDAELESVLRQVYVREGFTSDDIAQDSLAAESVRGRGDLITATIRDGSQLIGTVILVRPGSPAIQLAADTEAELHLLAVLPEFRQCGVGRGLLTFALDRARSINIDRVVLWTQPTMTAAHRLYESMGFKRCPEQDFRRNDRDFLVMRSSLTTAEI